MWKAIEGFLADTDAGRQSVDTLFDLLRRPPFGLKDGVLPVILAAILVHGHAQVALYEEGIFRPAAECGGLRADFPLAGEVRAAAVPHRRATRRGVSAIRRHAHPAGVRAPGPSQHRAAAGADGEGPPRLRFQDAADRRHRAARAARP